MQQQREKFKPMGANDSAVRLSDGAYDFSYGVDSSRVTTVQSETTPQGLPRNSLAWGDNLTVRGGGIQQRNGWLQLLKVLAQGAGTYQGGWLYVPRGGQPYLMVSIAGQIYQCLLDGSNTVVNLSSKFGLINPKDAAQVWMTQGEEFLIIQAGDFFTNPTPTLPLFWDGTTLRRSLGLTLPTTPTTQETLTTLAGWNIPAVGGNVVVTLSANYPGSVGDILTWNNYGTFQVSAITNASAGPPVVASSITLVTIASNFAASTTAHPYTVNLGGGLTETFSGVSTSPGALIIPGAYTLPVVPSASVPPKGPTPELPAGTCMTYYDGILWYAQGTQYIGGDIVLSQTGTLAYGFRDAILKVTQNQLAVTGQGFSVPAQAGNITALFYTANLNTSLGQGPLYIGTRTSVYQLTVPATLTGWTAANNSNQPVQTVAQFRYGPVGDRSPTLVNGDVFYTTLEPAIRSFQISQRYFGQWANVPISNNENRVLRFNNRALMETTSGIEFNNRMLQTILPVTTPAGVAFQGIAPLDFDLISTLQQQRPPAWEGMQEGLNHLQLFEGDFGGLQRAFSVVWSDPNAGGDGGIWIWEMTGDSNPSQRDKVDSRVTWYFETPAFTFSDEFALKELDWMQIWLDRVSGQIDMNFEYRADADSCWRFWAKTQFCAARSSCEDVVNPICYPEQPYCEGQRFPIGLPRPPALDCVTMNQRPPNIGYQFQVRVTIKGWCRVRGLLLRALPKNTETFANIIC